MNRSELAIELARRTSLTHAKAVEVLEVLFSGSTGLIATELAAGQRVLIPGFGSFVVRKRSARESRHPTDGRVISLPARRFPAFKAGETLRALLAC